MVVKLCQNGLNVVIGRKGSGKSTAAAALARSWKKGPVLSNLRVNGTFYYNPSDLAYFYPPEGSLVIIDEGGISFNNREWKSFNSQLISFFKYQRHCKCTVVLFTQAWDIDVTLKRLVDRLYYLNKVFYFTFVHNVRIKWKWTEISGSDGSDYVAEMKPSLLPSSVYFIPRYWKYFDSYELPVREKWELYCTKV